MADPPVAGNVWTAIGTFAVQPTGTVTFSLDAPDPDPNSVTGRIITTETFGAPGSTVNNPSAGVFTRLVDCEVGGRYTARFQAGPGTAQGAVEDTWWVNSTRVGWPFSFGYCGVDDVQARINAGAWNPYDPAASPTAQQTINFIQQASALIDAALMANGYTVPLTPRSGFTSIMPQAWTLLRGIAAELATAYVEQARHGSQDTNVDANANAHMKIAADMMARIGVRPTTVGLSAAASTTPAPLNLYVFGVDGTFAPVADKSLGMRFTGTAPGNTDAYGNVVPDPFTMGMDLT